MPINLISGQAPAGPRSIGIHVTGRCVLACAFCPYHFDKTRDIVRNPREITLAQFERIMQSVERLKTPWVNFTGEGEPFEHPHIETMITHVKNLGLKLDVNSNGILLTENKQCLIERIDSLNINCPGVDEESYAGGQNHSKSFYTLVRKNIACIARWEMRPRLNWVYLITHQSAQNLERVLPQAAEIGYDEVTFVLPFLHAGTMASGLNVKQAEEVRHKAATVLRQEASGKLGVLQTNMKHVAQILTQSMFFDAPKRADSFNKRLDFQRSFYFERSFPKNFRCQAGWREVVVDLKGNVILCCGNLHTIIGNTEEQDLYHIWHGERAAHMRLDIRDQMDRSLPHWQECLECPYPFDRD